MFTVSNPRFGDPLTTSEKFNVYVGRNDAAPRSASTVCSSFPANTAVSLFQPRYRSFLHASYFNILFSFKIIILIEDVQCTEGQQTTRHRAGTHLNLDSPRSIPLPPSVQVHVHSGPLLSNDGTVAFGITISSGAATRSTSSLCGLDGQVRYKRIARVGLKDTGRQPTKVGSRGWRGLEGG